jgi:lipoyl(octanoyl) transferase
MVSACRVCWLGQNVDYRQAWELQRRLVAQRAVGEVPDTLLLLEHSNVYTAGRRAKPEHVLLDAGGLRELGVPLVETDRGGEVTYHGPGQLVGYPIFSLSARGLGPRQYVRSLERVLIATLADFGICAHVEEGITGVWVYRAKIGAIGVKVSQGVAHHGFALNVAPDLGYYRHIVPCGIAGCEVTSMAELLGYAVAMEAVRGALVRRFALQFGVTCQPVPASAL